MPKRKEGDAFGVTMPPQGHRGLSHTRECDYVFVSVCSCGVKETTWGLGQCGVWFMVRT